MFSLNKHKNKLIAISFVLVFCFMILTPPTISPTLSADDTAESKKAGSLSTSYFNAATYGWVWMSGNKTTYENGVYGTKGVPDMGNYPGARSFSVSWTDTDGNFWLFGGLGRGESVNSGNLNDLWRFSITSKEWTWMSGNKTTNVNGTYGSKGVPDVANYPGG